MIRAKTLPHNPNAAYLTSTGWQMPDGTFKSFERGKVAIQPVMQPTRWQRLFGRVK